METTSYRCRQLKSSTARHDDDAGTVYQNPNSNPSPYYHRHIPLLHEHLLTMSAQSFRQIVGLPGSTATASDSTLIIIDAQNEYAEGKLKVSNAESTRKAIAALLKKYRDASGSIIHVTHKVPEGAPVFTPQTNLAKEFAELEPKDGEKVIQKPHPSCFADTELHELLGGSKKLVLVGYMVR